MGIAWGLCLVLYNTWKSQYMVLGEKCMYILYIARSVGIVVRKQIILFFECKCVLHAQKYVLFGTIDRFGSRNHRRCTDSRILTVHIIILHHTVQDCVFVPVRR